MSATEKKSKKDSVKKERKVKTSAEKPLKEMSASQLSKQTAELKRLLLVWPECPNSILERFVKDKFDVALTRRCVQEAKEELHLHEPQHSENTIKKRAYASYFIFNLAQFYGVGGLTEEQFSAKVTRALNEKFEEKTHSRMIKLWVQEDLQMLVPYAANPAGVLEMVRTAKSKLAELGISSLVTGEQDLI